MSDERDWQPEDEYTPESEADPEPDLPPPAEDAGDEVPPGEPDDYEAGADDAADEGWPAPPPEEDAPPPDDAYAATDFPPPEPPPAEPSELGEGERLRQPRAQSFRRRLANQISMLPLALYLLAMGLYLIAVKQDVADLPEIASPLLGGGLLLALAASMMLHSIVYGRRERGLLFVGLWIWITAGAVALLAFTFEDTPDAREWWPVLLLSLGLALLLTYVVERAHDARLVLVSLCVFVAAGVAFWTTLGNADLDRLEDAADYWPLLLAVLGIGLLPLAFRRRPAR